MAKDAKDTKETKSTEEAPTEQPSGNPGGYAPDLNAALDQMSAAEAEAKAAQETPESEGFVPDVPTDDEPPEAVNAVEDEANVATSKTSDAASKSTSASDHG